MESFRNRNEVVNIPLLILVIAFVLAQTTSAFACRLKIVLAMDISASLQQLNQVFTNTFVKRNDWTCRGLMPLL